MGILADFFVATHADALLYEQLLGDLPAERYEVVNSGRLTALEIGSLWAILDGVEWDFKQHELINHTPPDESAESWLSEFPAPLTAKLASIDDAAATKCAEAWSETEELEGADSDDLSDFVGELRGLAQHAQASGNALYLWNSL